MSELLDALGKAKLERLSLLHGGTRLRIPLELRHGLAPPAFARRVGGEDIAILLILHFGQSSVYVPLLDRGRAGGPERVSVKAVMRLTGRNLSANAIAKRLGCSVRVVYRKRAKHRARMLPPIGASEGSPAHGQGSPA